MSFDKSKAMRNADRFLSQGKYRAAISEYKRIVENDPKDFTTLNILGDLHVKNNEEAEAIGCFTQVAEHYSKQGFAQKAIAIYNKIARLQPNSLEVSSKLAHLYKLKGSFVEARTHYVAVAEQYQRQGQKAQALEVWKQVAQLDPNNTEVYLKIAGFCLEDDQKDEAARALTDAGIRLAQQEKYEDALSAFSRALEIYPFDIVALNGFVKAQIKLGNADEAASTLESILEQQPFNREILYLLADCYLDMNNPAEAEKFVTKLVEQEPANHLKFLHVVEVYVRNDDLASAVRILGKTADHLMVSSNSEEFLKWINEILARDPEQLEALRLSVRFHTWQRDESELKNALVRLAEAARAQNVIEEERFALSQLVVIMPHDASFAARFEEINGSGQAAERAPAEASAGVQSVSAPPGFESDVPTFESFAVLNNDVEIDGGSGLALDDYHAVDGHVESSNGSYDFSDAALDQNDWSGFAGTDWSAETESLASQWSNGNSDLSPADKSFEIQTGGFVLDDGAPVGMESFGSPFDAGSFSGPGLSVSDEHRIHQEVEGIEFYISEGYIELAETSLCSLEAEFGDRPEFLALRRKLGGSAPKAAEESAHRPAETVTADRVSEKGFAARPESQQGFDLLEDFRAELELEDSEADAEGDYDTHYHMAIAYKEMGLMEDAIKLFQNAVKLVRPDDGTRRFFQCCILLGHCFMESGMPNLALVWFRRAPETPGLNDEEHQALLYEMANAYEADGETPKALECFEQIYAVNVDYRDVSQRLDSLRSHHLVA